MSGPPRPQAATAAKPVLILAGPTASGKSGLALALAERLNGAVINADSMQVYRELAILTARPGPPALARAPHRLYGVLAAAEACSAGRWRGLAEREIAAAHGAGLLPIVTGGTGLYISALVGGLSPIPEVPAEIRAAARALSRRIGGEAFHAALAERDPETAARLRPSDRQRLLRAWEVLAATGQPLARWQAEAKEGPPAEWRFAAILLEPPRAALYRACEARFDAMLAAGALAEVEALLALGLDPALPAMRAVGVAELARHLRGELSLAAAAALAKQATRRLAKRQVTWLRHHPPASILLAAQDSESAKGEIFNFIRRFLLTAAAPSV
jgi:tRNA dimethylallyltransferase